MVILLPILIMLATAAALAILHFTRPGFRYPWMLATGGASLALAAVFAWQIQSPHTFSLPAWQPHGVFHDHPSWLADVASWPYALALAALAAAVIWTSVVRLESEPLSWAGTLTLAAIGLLAVTAATPLTLVLAWSALDLAELLTMLRSTHGEARNQSLVIALATRLAGTGMVLLASMLSLTRGVQLDFRNTPPQIGIYLIVGAGLRLGVLPLHLPYLRENVHRRGFGTSLRLVSAAACLALLARIQAGAVQSAWLPVLLILSAATGLYAGWMWLRASDEIIGRPYWVLGMASLAVQASLRGDPTGSTAWGSVLILGGVLLFLFSARRRSILWMLLPGMWGLSALPYSATASAWASGSDAWLTVIPFFVVQGLFAAGFLRHCLHPGETSLESQEKWVQVIYPIGLLIPAGSLVLLGLWGWPGAGVLKPWIPGAIAILIAAILFTLSARGLLRFEAGAQAASWARISHLGWLYALLTAVFGWLRRLADLISGTLEGEGGLLWSFLLLVLIISVLAGGGQP